MEAAWGSETLVSYHNTGVTARKTLTRIFTTVKASNLVSCFVFKVICHSWVLILELRKFYYVIICDTPLQVQWIWPSHYNTTATATEKQSHHDLSNYKKCDPLNSQAHTCYRYIPSFTKQSVKISYGINEGIMQISTIYCLYSSFKMHMLVLPLAWYLGITLNFKPVPMVWHTTNTATWYKITMDVQTDQSWNCSWNSVLADDFQNVNKKYKLNLMSGTTTIQMLCCKCWHGCL